MDVLLRTLLLISVGTAVLVAVTATDAQASGKTRILLLGDSILDCLQGQNRVEHRMLEKLTARRPDVAFDVWNMARGGMWIGPADTTGIVGIAEPLFDGPSTGWYFRVREQHPEADVIVVLFGGNDGKVYSPTAYGERLAVLCERLRQDYPGARLVLATGMYQDPAHETGYRRDPSMVSGFVQGSSRNDYLGPYFDQVRALAQQRGYGLADICARVRTETAAGNWDLRVRQDGTLDAARDAEHPNDLAWFTNIHPNPRGVDVIAEVLVEVVLQQD